MIKQRIMPTEIPEVKWIRHMRPHNSGNIQGENLHIWAVKRKYHFSKTKMYFHKKTTPQLLGHIGLQNMKVGEKTNLGRLATIFRILGDLPQYFKFVRWMLTSLKFLPLQSENNVWKCFDIFTKARYPLPKMNKMAAQNNENKNGNQRKSYPKFFFYRSLSL